MVESKPKFEFPENLPVSKELLSQCVRRPIIRHVYHGFGIHTYSGERSVLLDDISQIIINKPDSSSLDRIPEDYMYEPFGVGDTYHIEIVSFITDDNKVLYNIVPQNVYHYVDDAGQNDPEIKNGKRISDVLKEMNKIKYVVSYRWEFDGTPKDRKNIVNRKTLEIMEVV